MGSLYALSHFWNALSNADKINFTIAVCTGIAALAAAYSAWLGSTLDTGGARRIACPSFPQRAAYERQVNFSGHMGVVRKLRGELAKDLTDEQRKSILVALVNFLNHVAHLIRHRYVVPKQMLLLYAPSIAACRDNLLGDGQWLKEERKQTGEPRYYLHFTKLCQKETETLIWSGKAESIVWTTDPYQPSLPTS